MKNLRRRFDRFCFQNRDKGIPNLMLYLCLGTAVVYVLSMATNNFYLYDLLCFDRTRILQGQVWRLISYPLLTYRDNMLMQMLYLFCYYSLGRAMENYWGSCKFTMFYVTGVLMMDVYCMIFGCQADVYYLNTSLFLSYATLYPSAQFLLFFIIPVKAWVLALFNLLIVLMGLVGNYFPYNLFSVISLANYFLFFGKDVLNVIPISWRINARRLFSRGKKKASGSASQADRPKTIPFPSAGSYEASVAKPKAPYTHRCTVCGRTDISDPDLEFRYCSRCRGYHCYCMEHINNHSHIE